MPASRTYGLLILVVVVVAAAIGVGAVIRDDGRGDSMSFDHVATLTHSDSAVRSLAFAPDGAVVAAATGSEDGGMVVLWDVATHESIRTLGGDGHRPSAVAFSPDGELLAAPGTTRAVNSSPDPETDFTRLWDPTTGDLVRELDDGTESAAFSPSGELLATGDFDKVTLWDPQTGEQLEELSCDCGGAATSSVTFSPDGEVVAVGAARPWATLWDTGTGDELASLSHEDDDRSDIEVAAVAFSPDGSLVATATEGFDDADRSVGSVHLWDAATYEPAATLSHDGDDPPLAAAFSPDGRLLATGFHRRPPVDSPPTARPTGEVWVWDVARREPVARLAHDDGTPITAVAFSPDGELLATGGPSGEVWLWEPAG